MYRFDTTFRSNGSAVVRYDHRAAPDARTLARMLVEDGEPDGEVVGGREREIDWRCSSLHGMAARTLSEGDKGFVRGIYAPYPVRPLHPALQAAVDAAHEAKRKRAA